MFEQEREKKEKKKHREELYVRIALTFNYLCIIYISVFDSLYLAIALNVSCLATNMTVKLRWVTNVQLCVCVWISGRRTKWALKHAPEEFMVIANCIACTLYYAYLRNFNRYLISLITKIRMAIAIRLAVSLHLSLICICCRVKSFA